MKTMNVRPLTQWRWIVINSSGGKDSQTALREVYHLCCVDGVDLKRLVISHQCLGEQEWPGTLDLVREHAEHYGLRLEVSSYRDRDGVEGSLLDYVRKRRMWPSSQQRFCTSEFKRGPGGRVLVKLYRESPGRLLNVYGFRADESPARAKKPVFIRNARFSTLSREVWDWLPIHNWTLPGVWNDIKGSGVRHHAAYDIGMPRLSCRLCIFAPRGALILAGKANPETLEAYIAVEKEIDHTFQHGRSLSEIKTAIESGEQPGNLNGAWNM